MSDHSGTADSVNKEEGDVKDGWFSVTEKTMEGYTDDNMSLHEWATVHRPGGKLYEFKTSGSSAHERSEALAQNAQGGTTTPNSKSVTSTSKPSSSAIDDKGLQLECLPPGTPSGLYTGSQFSIKVPPRTSERKYDGMGETLRVGLALHSNEIVDRDSWVQLFSTHEPCLSGIAADVEGKAYNYVISHQALRDCESDADVAYTTDGRSSRLEKWYELEEGTARCITASRRGIVESHLGGQHVKKPAFLSWAAIASGETWCDVQLSEAIKSNVTNRDHSQTSHQTVSRKLTRMNPHLLGMAFTLLSKDVDCVSKEPPHPDLVRFGNIWISPTILVRWDEEESACSADGKCDAATDQYNVTAFEWRGK